MKTPQRRMSPSMEIFLVKEIIGCLPGSSTKLEELHSKKKRQLALLKRQKLELEKKQQEIDRNIRSCRRVLAYIHGREDMQSEYDSSLAPWEEEEEEEEQEVGDADEEGEEQEVGDPEDQGESEVADEEAEGDADEEGEEQEAGDPEDQEESEVAEEEAEEGEGNSEDQGRVESEDALVQEYMQKWAAQEGATWNIPKKYTPCKYYFKAARGCRKDQCEFSHDDVFLESPAQELLESISWERHHEKSRARPRERPPREDRRNKGLDYYRRKEEFFDACRDHYASYHDWKNAWLDAWEDLKKSGGTTKKKMKRHPPLKKEAEEARPHDSREEAAHSRKKAKKEAEDTRPRDSEEAEGNARRWIQNRKKARRK